MCKAATLWFLLCHNEVFNHPKEYIHVVGCVIYLIIPYLAHWSVDQCTSYGRLFSIFTKKVACVLTSVPYQFLNPYLTLWNSDQVCCCSPIAVPNALSSANLLPVSIDMLTRGTPQVRAEICLPSEVDIQTVSTDDSSPGPVIEPYKGKKPKDRDSTHSTMPGHSLPTSRQVIGYVTAGGYSLTHGISYGRGLVTLQSYLTCLNRKDLTKSRSNTQGTLCLIRAHDSRQYRFALLNIADNRWWTMHSSIKYHFLSYTKFVLELSTLYIV